VPRGFEEHPSAFGGGLCVTDTSMSSIHTIEDANLAFKGHTGCIARVQTHGPPQSIQAQHDSLLCIQCSIFSVKTGRKWRISYLEVQKCGQWLLCHSFAVRPWTSCFPYQDLCFSICATRRSESTSLKTSIADVNVWFSQDPQSCVGVQPELLTLVYQILSEYLSVMLTTQMCIPLACCL
jgi:hypothetical protein